MILATSHQSPKVKFKLTVKDSMDKLPLAKRSHRDVAVTTPTARTVVASAPKVSPDLKVKVKQDVVASLPRKVKKNLRELLN
jgi:hypothetical protein